MLRILLSQTYFLSVVCFSPLFWCRKKGGSVALRLYLALAENDSAASPAGTAMPSESVKPQCRSLCGARFCANWKVRALHEDNRDILLQYIWVKGGDGGGVHVKGVFIQYASFYISHMVFYLYGYSGKSQFPQLPHS